MIKNKQYYSCYIFEILTLTIISSIFCFKFNIAYNEMDIFPYAQATFLNGLTENWHIHFKFPSNFIFNYTLGFFMSKFDPFSMIILARLVSYIMISFSYIYLSRVLKISFLASTFNYVVFLYFFKNGIGDAGEWIIGGLESKVFAYSLVIFSLSSFLKFNYKRGFLFAGLALSTHLLVGAYNLICLIPILSFGLINKKITFYKLMIACSYFIITGIIGISEIIHSAFSNIPKIIQEKGWDIYVNIRVPHHTIPNFSSDTWLKLSILTLITLIFINSKHTVKRLIASYSLLSVIIIIIGFTIYYFFESHYMRYYFFRFSDIMLPYLTLLLITTFYKKLKYIYLLLIFLIIIPDLIYKNHFSEFTSVSSYSINYIKEKTNSVQHKTDNILDLKIMEWITKNTNKTDQFIVPPDNLYFCMNTEREIFVSWWMLPEQYDYKTVADIPSDMIEWYERLKRLNLNIDFSSLNEVKRNYTKLNIKNIKSIKNKYKSVKYILMSNKIQLDLPIAIQANTQVLYYIN